MCRQHIPYGPGPKYSPTYLCYDILQIIAHDCTLYLDYEYRRDTPTLASSPRTCIGIFADSTLLNATRRKYVPLVAEEAEDDGVVALRVLRPPPMQVLNWTNKTATGTENSPWRGSMGAGRLRS
jgi:hypothetical protein